MSPRCFGLRCAGATVWSRQFRVLERKQIHVCVCVCTWEREMVAPDDELQVPDVRRIERAVGIARAEITRVQAAFTAFLRVCGGRASVRTVRLTLT